MFRFLIWNIYRMRIPKTLIKHSLINLESKLPKLPNQDTSIWTQWDSEWAWDHQWEDRWVRWEGECPKEDREPFTTPGDHGENCPRVQRWRYLLEISLRGLQTPWSDIFSPHVVPSYPGREFRELRGNFRWNLSKVCKQLSKLFCFQAFGFCEYNNPDAGLRAMRLLNDFNIADKDLVV